MKKTASSYASAAGPPAAAAAAAVAPPMVHFGSLVSTVEGGKLSSGPSRATFDVFGVDLCVVNAMRRGVMADVPTVAIAFEPTASKTERDAGIQFFKNTGVLHNEFLGHRINVGHAVHLMQLS